MQLSDGYALKTPLWTENEEVKNTDLSTISEVIYKNTIDTVAALIAPMQSTTGDANVIVGDGLRIVWSAAMTGYIHPGIALSFSGSYYSGSVWGFTADPGKVFGVVVAEPTAVSVDEGGSGNRIDTIEIRPTVNTYDSQARNVRDPLSGAVVTALTYTRVEYGVEVQVLKGTEGAGVAPASTAGWIKIAEVTVDASATALAQYNYLQCGEYNRWTTAPTSTVRRSPYSQWSTKVTTATATLERNTRHLIEYSSTVLLTLPATAKVGDVLEIDDINGNGYTIVQLDGQNIIYNDVSTLPIAGGAISSIAAYSSIKLLCVVEGTTWQVIDRYDTALILCGYYVGGYTGSASAIITKHNFNTGTVSTLSETTDTTTNIGCGMSGSVKGYTCGGNGVTDDVVSAFTYSTELAANLGVTLSQPILHYLSGGNSQLKGYAFDYARVHTVTFATESLSYLGSTLPDFPYYTAEVQSKLKAYVAGGSRAGTYSTIRGVTFSSDAIASLSATLDVARAYAQGLSGLYKGYVVGGATTLSSVEDVNFSTETSALLSVNLPLRQYGGGNFSGVDVGYCVGGPYGGSISTRVQALNYPTETSATSRAVLATGRMTGGSIQGYISG